MVKGEMIPEIKSEELEGGIGCQAVWMNIRSDRK
jgi:hypothetical protein